MIIWQFDNLPKRGLGKAGAWLAHGWGTKLKYRGHGWGKHAWGKVGARMGYGWGTFELMTFNRLGHGWGTVGAQNRNSGGTVGARLRHGLCKVAATISCELIFQIVTINRAMLRS